MIVDAFGSPTILKDANTFRPFTGLPKLTANEFRDHQSWRRDRLQSGGWMNPANWVGETTLDVEWAHAVAPEANILLMQAKDNTFTNLDLAVFLAASNQLGSVISNSYGAPES